ncbi:MAG: hypothetical protein K0S34_1091 [Bacillales bacterium]|jgi:hypothetical protein|nr:hypothetical protein [Bacillales bacterium]
MIIAIKSYQTLYVNLKIFLMSKKSFYSDDHDYVASHDGVFKNGTYYENKSGKLVNVSKCKKGYNRFVKYVDISNFILSRNTA